MKKCCRIFFFYSCSCLLNRHDCANLIVYMHKRYKNRILPYGIFQLLNTYHAVMVNRQICDFKALLLKKLHHRQNRCMLDRGCDDMPSGSLICHCSTYYCSIIRLCATGCKEYLLVLHPECLCNLFLSIINIIFCLNTLHMKR